MQLVSLYPYDPTGLAATNKIVNETITVTPPTQVTDYSYVVPRAAPFFAESLVVKDGKTVGARTLVENVDYWCVIDFLSASVALNKRISVGIALLDPSYSGTLYVSYQALGGNYSLADYSVLEELIRERYVVKHVSYEQIANLPEGFAPEWHQHEVKDMVGMSQVVAKLGDIKGAVAGREGSYSQLDRMVTNHINSDNAHSPSQVGLGNVRNFGIATLADAGTGSANKYVTADVLKQYVKNNAFDSTGYLTTANAELTYAKLTALTDYDTRAVANGKYAPKGDTYTKAEVEALISGVDMSDSFSGFYTKGESDNKFFLKTDIAAYIKETIADTRYATKTQLTDYYSKTISDGRYAYKSDSYTKTESDGRYMSVTNMSGYLTKTDASNLYLTLDNAKNLFPMKPQVYMPSALKTSYAALKHIDLELESTSFDGSFKKSLKCSLNLERYALTNETIEVDKFWWSHNLHLKNTNGVWLRTFNSQVVYGAYKLNIKWTIKRVGATIILTWECGDAFYFAEGLFYLYTPSNLGIANASPQAASGANPSTTLSQLLSTLGLAGYITPTTCYNDIINNGIYADYWVRLAAKPRVNKSDGSIIIPMMVNGSQGNNVTLYCYGFIGAMSFTIDDPILDLPLMTWFQNGNASLRTISVFDTE